MMKQITIGLVGLMVGGLVGSADAQTGRLDIDNRIGNPYDSQIGKVMHVAGTSEGLDGLDIIYGPVPIGYG